MIYDGDVKLYPTEDGGQITLKNGQPYMDDGMETAVYISLFSGDYWGNAISERDEKLESKLESLYSRTLTNQTRLDAEQYALQALAWMKRQGIAAKIEAEASIPRTGMLGLVIKIYQPDVDDPLILKYQINWANQQISMGAA